MSEEKRDTLEDEFRRLKEKQRVMEECPFLFFEPYGDQQAFLNCHSKIRLITGGNRTGKSTVGVIEAISHVMGFRPDGNRDYLPPGAVDILAMVNDRRKSVDKILMKKIRSFCPKDWITHVKNGTDGFPEILTFRTGSRLFIGSYKQDAATYEGHDWHGVWFDEPPPRPVFVSIRRGCLDHGGRIWFTLTPLSCPWIYTELYAKADSDRISTFHLDLMDNPHIPEEEKLLFIADLNPEEIEARIHGKFSHLSGSIFPTFSRDKHTVDDFTIPDEWPRFMVMDPHDRRPSYIAWFAVNPRDQIICYREWPRDEFAKIKTAHKSVRDYTAIIRTEEGSEKLYERIIDPNFGKTPSVMTGNTLIDEYANHGLDFYAEINNDIQLGHQRIHERLRTDIGEPKLVVAKSCRNMIWAFENYIWNTRDMEKEYGARERPDETGKDMIDALRYLLDYEPTYSMGQAIMVDDAQEHGITGYGV